jgi:hypothetical protein
MIGQPTALHEIAFSACVLIPLWLPLVALALAWRNIEKKVFFLITGILASSGVQHFFGYMQLLQISQGASLYNPNGTWSELALEVIYQSLPIFICSVGFLFWAAKILSKENLTNRSRPTSQAAPEPRP